MEKIKVRNICSIAKGFKFRFAGCIARETEPKWNKITTFWVPHDRKRRKGRPNTRWVDELVKGVGPDWRSQARDRLGWRCVANTYAPEMGS